MAVRSCSPADRGHCRGATASRQWSAPTRRFATIERNDTPAGGSDGSLEQRISAEYLAEHLAEILDEVEHAGTRFVLERDGLPIAVIERKYPVPPVTGREIMERIGHLRPPGEGFADDLEEIQRSQGYAEVPDWPA